MADHRNAIIHESLARLQLFCRSTVCQRSRMRLFLMLRRRQLLMLTYDQRDDATKCETTTSEDDGCGSRPMSLSCGSDQICSSAQLSFTPARTEHRRRQTPWFQRLSCLGLDLVVSSLCINTRLLPPTTQVIQVEPSVRCVFVCILTISK